LRVLDDRLRDPQELAAFAAQLAELHSQLKSTPMQLLAVAEDHKLAGVVQGASAIWTADNPGSLAAAFELNPIRERRGEMWLTNTQVNFCARAYPTVPVQHPDAAALTVLGGVLRNGFLHRAIREQGGAYGGGASQDSGVAAFRFYSYRDPRLAETLRDFDAAVTWMLDTSHEYRALEEAILGVIGSMDKPSSPAGEAKQHFHNRLFGRSHDQRELFRQQILAVSLDDLRRVTETYLQPELASTAVVTSSSQLDSTASLREELDLTVREL
jgi:Zn-dependent M16 (insulinase) family peptidase